MEFVKDWWVVWAAVTALGLLSGIIAESYFHRENPEPIKASWCVAGEINQNGELVYSQNYAGETEFTVFVTADGPVLMTKCHD